MGSADYLKLGSHNKICDRTGFKIKADDSQQEWNNLVVRRRSWEQRQPQDFLRSVRDDQTVPNPRSEQEDVFLETNEVKAEDL